MAVTFRYKEYLSGSFGKIRRPVANIHFQTPDKLWVPIEMLIDTGSDYTLLPKSFSRELGISISRDCNIIGSRGVGGDTEVYILKRKIKARLGNYQRMIPLGFASNDSIPPLMGRQEFFETFKVTFNKFKVTFE